MGFLLPPSLCVTTFLGGLAAATRAKHRAEWSQEYLFSVAGGAIAGEALLAVLRGRSWPWVGYSRVKFGALLAPA